MSRVFQHISVKRTYKRRLHGEPFQLWYTNEARLNGERVSFHTELSIFDSVWILRLRESARRMYRNWKEVFHDGFAVIESAPPVPWGNTSCRQDWAKVFRALLGAWPLEKIVWNYAFQQCTFLSFENSVPYIYIYIIFYVLVICLRKRDTIVITIWREKNLKIRIYFLFKPRIFHYKIILNLFYLHL